MSEHADENERDTMSTITKIAEISASIDAMRADLRDLAAIAKDRKLTPAEITLYREIVRLINMDMLERDRLIHS